MKYSNVSHKSGEHYARITTVDGEIDAAQTYTDSYCKKNGLGKYANSGSSSSVKSSGGSRGGGSGIGKALGAGAVGVAKWAFTVSPEEKARKAERAAESEAIDSIVEPMIKNLKSELKSKYPQDTKDATVMLSYITELDELVQEHSVVSKSGDDLDSKASHKYETERLEIESAYLYKLIKRLNNKTNLKDIRKRAKKYMPVGVVTIILRAILLVAVLYMLAAILAEM